MRNYVVFAAIVFSGFRHSLAAPLLIEDEVWLGGTVFTEVYYEDLTGGYCHLPVITADTETFTIPVTLGQTATVYTSCSFADVVFASGVSNHTGGGTWNPANQSLAQYSSLHESIVDITFSRGISWVRNWGVTWFRRVVVPDSSGLALFDFVLNGQNGSTDLLVTGLDDGNISVVAYVWDNEDDYAAIPDTTPPENPEEDWGYPIIIFRTLGGLAFTVNSSVTEGQPISFRGNGTPFGFHSLTPIVSLGSASEYWGSEYEGCGPGSYASQTDSTLLYFSLDVW